MSTSFRRLWLAPWLCLLATQAAAQGVAAHTPPHPAPPSLLPETQEMAAADRALAYSGTPIDVLTYHYDDSRTGWNQHETDLTPTSVASARFGLLATLQVDGNVFAQPLLVSGFAMPDGSTHDVLLVVTGHDSVYAFDASTFAILWHVSLGKPQSTASVGCGDVHPEYGISGTPVILRAGAGAATVYLVAATEPSPSVFSTQLHALNLADGSDVVPPVEVEPSATLADGSTLTFDPQNQWNRAGLAMRDGSIYVGIGSHCDNNPYNISGWLLRYSTSLVPQRPFHTIETPHGYELASIWMTGFAPAIDAAGDLFVVTGNGDFTAGARDWGESVLSLTPKLGSVRTRFTPSAFAALNQGDTDFGSGGVMLLPPVAGQTAPPMAVAMGKDAVLYLLDQTALGGRQAGDAGALDARRLGSSGSGLWGGPAFYDGPKNGPTVYAQVDHDVLRAFSVATTGTPRLSPGATGTTEAGYGGSLPIVSSNGGAPGSGVVWLIRRSAPFQLEAYDADALGAPLFAANVGSWSNPGQGNPFLTPMEANGRVYAPGYKLVRVFGLTP